MRLMGSGEERYWQTLYLNKNMCSVLHKRDSLLCKVTGSVYISLKVFREIFLCLYFMDTVLSKK